MNSFFKHLIKRKIIIPVIFFILVIISLLLLPFVDVSYDMAAFLPDHAGTKQAINVAKEEFAYPGTANVMAKEVTLAEALEIKAKLLQIQGVKSIVWLDDVVDITKPIQHIPKETLLKYYINRYALFNVEFIGDNYSEITSEALETVQTLDPRLVISGDAENARHMKNVLSGEIIRIIAFVLPICLLILLLASHSWIEPLLYLIVIGISIIINMGTNAFFGSISFITNSMASVLQLAICMDYSIFLMHRYFEERDLGNDSAHSVKNASVKSFKSVTASAMTTIAGFIALIFMRYKIGADVGLVLAKGILISFISVMVLMPVLINLFSKTLDNSRHRFLLPSFGKIGSFTHRIRYLILVLLIITIVPAFLAQKNNSFFYGDSSVTTGEGQAYENRKEVTDVFGISNSIMILVPKGNKGLEISVASDLMEMPYTKDVLSIASLADPAVPESFLPDSLINNFTSENYSRMILYLNFDGETEETFKAVSMMRIILQDHYPDEWYAAGVATSLADIKDTVNKDSTLVSLISLAAVAFVIMIVFKSLSIPLILLLVIQGSVWLNMSIPYYSDFKMAFIGYLVISSLQLGATIDYGILLTNRYVSYRGIHGPKNAAFNALKSSGHSIVVSALILSTSGFGFGIVSQMSSISELGILIGRGAILSCLMTLFLLPVMLTVFDKLVLGSTLKGSFKK